MTLIYLIEADVRTDAAGTAGVLRRASNPGYNHPSAPGYYPPELKNPLVLRRTAFGSGRTSGAIEVGAGDLELVNLGSNDGLIDWGFDGGKLSVKLVDHLAAYSTAKTIATLTMDQPEFVWDKIVLRVRDRLQELETRQLQPNRYAGTNSGGNGVEGTANDIAGKPKPLGFGRLRNVPAVLVNAQKQIYQVNDGAVASIDAVYDRGSPLTLNGSYASQAAMEAAAPAAGQFRPWLGGGFFRLGGASVGQITADVTVGAAASDRTAAQILKAMAIGPGGIASGDVVAGDVTALDAANGAELGAWFDAETSVRAAMELISNSVGAWFGFDRLGLLRMRRFEAPTGSPVFTFRRLIGQAAPLSSADIIKIERRATNDTGNGLPIKTATLTYRRCWQTQTSDLAGVVTDATRAFLKEATRKVTSTDASVALRYRGAGVRDFESLIDDPTAAQNECDRRLALHKVRRDYISVRAWLDQTIAETVDLGSVVAIDLPRFGFGGGKLFVVLGVEYDAAAKIIALDLWG